MCASDILSMRGGKREKVIWKVDRRCDVPSRAISSCSFENGGFLQATMRRGLDGVADNSVSLVVFFVGRALLILQRTTMQEPLESWGNGRRLEMSIDNYFREGFHDVRWRRIPQISQVLSVSFLLFSSFSGKGLQ